MMLEKDGFVFQHEKINILREVILNGVMLMYLMK